MTDTRGGPYSTTRVCQQSSVRSGFQIGENSVSLYNQSSSNRHLHPQNIFPQFLRASASPRGILLYSLPALCVHSLINTDKLILHSAVINNEYVQSSRRILDLVESIDGRHYCQPAQSNPHNAPAIATAPETGHVGHRELCPAQLSCIRSWFLRGLNQPKPTP